MLKPSAGISCQRCGSSAGLADGDGLCPICLLQTALDIDPAEEASAPLFEKGTCGIYQIESLIGRGGNGMVYLARHPESGRQVAIKMLASAHLAGPDELRRFRLEADAVAELIHPNIIRVHECGEEDGAPWFAMDYASGGSLADTLSDSATPEALRSALRQRVEISIKIARAVHFAHERGVLHRDLKPANILIDAKGNPLVADFGLARMIHDPSGVTMTGAALGTPAYMAPEQAAGGVITTSSDVYSLGALLYHLLTGRPPFEAATPLETLRLVTSRDAPDPRSTAPWIDKDLAMVCLKALRREREARYQSATALADDLEAWCDGGEVTARPLPWPERFVKWFRRHPIAATLTGATALGVIVLGTVLVVASLMLREERNNALNQEAAAVRNAVAATYALEDSRLHSYAADMYLAFRALDDGHLGLARRMLARQRPPAGMTDLRGFEWHALTRRARGDELMSWHEHQGAVYCVAFSPDGKQLASGSRDGLVFIRSVPQGEILLALPKPGAERGLAEIPLMTAIAARSAEMTKFMISHRVNPDDYRMRARPSSLGEITSLAFSADGRSLATAGLGNYVRVWSLPAGELTRVVPVRTTTSLAFTPDGKSLVVHLHDEADQNLHETRIYKLPELSQQHVFHNLQGPIAVSPKDGVVAILPKGGSAVRLIDAATGKPIKTIEVAIPLRHLVFSHDGKLLHGVDFHGMTAATWSVDSGARVGTLFPLAGRFDRLIPSSCGEFFASTGAAQRIAWQHATGAAPARLLGGHEDNILALAISPDGRFLASGGNDHSLRLWQPARPVEGTASYDPFSTMNPPEEILRMAGKNGSIARVAMGYWITESGNPQHLRLVSNDLQTLRTLKAPSKKFLRLSASPNGQRLALFSWPRGVRVLAADGKSWSREWRISSGTVGPVVFSSNGSLIASGGDDNTISIWETTNGKLIAQLKGHQGAIIDLAFTPDGRTLASSAQDRTLRLWHCPTWRDLGTLHQGEIVSRIAFTADGRFLHALAADCVREFGMAR